MTDILTTPGLSTADPGGKPGGRPRDPGMAGRILEVTTILLAERGLTGFAMDDIAAHAGVGKASIYRRWRSLDRILVDVVADLGVRDVDWPATRPLEGDTRDDLIGLATAATMGTRASALRAVHGVLPYRTDLAAASLVGPERRLQEAIATARARTRDRGDVWPGSLRVHAAIALLNHGAAIHGRQPDPVEITAVVDAVVGYSAVTR